MALPCQSELFVALTIPKEDEMDVLEQLLAERDIRQLVSLYPQYADDSNDQGLAELFEENGAIVVGAHHVKGHAAIREWVLSVMKGKSLRHLMANAHIIVKSAEQASGTMDMVLLCKNGNAWDILASPRYTDDFINTGNGWKFAQRVIDPRV
jgi:hypothetical protein